MNSELVGLWDGLEMAFDRFRRISGELSPSTHHRPGACGDWSPKDIVAHLAGWDKSLHTFIMTPETFEPPWDVDAFNTKSVLEREQLSWEAGLSELQSGFKALKLAIEMVAPESKPYPRVCQWVKGRTADYELHGEQLRNFE